MLQMLRGITRRLGSIALNRPSPVQKQRAALREAIRRRDASEIKRLADSGMNLDFSYTWQFRPQGSPMAFAFLTGDRSISDILIAHGASTSPKSPGNQTLLVNAVRGGNIELVDLALSAGHDIHFKPQNYAKPLASAIHHQSIAMARFLVSKGAGAEDVKLSDCRWYAMRSEMICFVSELGMEVPKDVLACVEKGSWDGR